MKQKEIISELQTERSSLEIVVSSKLNLLLLDDSKEQLKKRKSKKEAKNAENQLENKISQILKETKILKSMESYDNFLKYERVKKMHFLLVLKNLILVNSKELSSLPVDQYIQMGNLLKQHVMGELQKENN